MVGYFTGLHTLLNMTLMGSPPLSHVITGVANVKHTWTNLVINYIYYILSAAGNPGFKGPGC